MVWTVSVWSGQFLGYPNSFQPASGCIISFVSVVAAELMMTFDISWKIDTTQAVTEVQLIQKVLKKTDGPEYFKETPVKMVKFGTGKIICLLSAYSKIEEKNC